MTDPAVEPTGSFRDFRSLSAIRALLARAPLWVRVSFLTSAALLVLGLPVTLVVYFDWLTIAIAQWGAPFVGTLAAAVACTVVLLFYTTAGTLLGRGWARIVITVLGILVTAYAVSLIGSADAFSAFDWADTLLSDVAVVLLWLPTSREFFRTAKADRAARVG